MILRRDQHVEFVGCTGAFVEWVGPTVRNRGLEEGRAVVRRNQAPGGVLRPSLAEAPQRCPPFFRIGRQIIAMRYFEGMKGELHQKGVPNRRLVMPQCREGPNLVAA